MPPKGFPGKAVDYSLKQRHRLAAYVETSGTTPDNNPAENAVRPSVIGKKS